MTGAGTKLISAAKEALEYAKCRHKRERLSTKSKGGGGPNKIDRCSKCGGKRYTWTAKIAATR